MKRSSPWVTRGGAYVLVVTLLALVGAFGPGLVWLLFAVGVLTLPAGFVISPLVTVLAIGLNSLVPGVTDPGDIHPALVAVPATAVSAVLNVLLLRTLLRARGRTGTVPQGAGAYPQGEAAPGSPLADGTFDRTGSSAVDQGDARTPHEQPAGGGNVLVVVAVLAFLAQGVVAMGTFVLGLGWGGPTYYAALLQVVFALGVIGWLVSRRRRIAVLVPLVSAALTALLLFAGEGLAAATGCSPGEQAVGEELAAPPGVDAALTGNMNGCFIHFETDIPVAEVGEHYRAEFAQDGWEPDTDTDGTVGATKDGIRATVYTEPLPGERTNVSIEFFEVPPDS